MNRMELVPHNADDFKFARRFEQLGRCVQFETSLQKCRKLQQEIHAATLLPEERARQLAYLAAIIHKLRHQHRENHLCYPFSIN